MNINEVFDKVRKDTRRAIDDIQKDFLRPDEDWMSIAQLYSYTNKQVSIVPMQYENDREKDMVASLIAAAVIPLDVDVVTFVFSAWRVSLHKDATPEEIEKARHASQHNDREEILLLTVVSADRTIIEMAPIIRDDKAPPRLGEWESQGVPAESRFIDPVVRQLVMRKRSKKGGKKKDA